jgi:hypothetical protein
LLTFHPECFRDHTVKDHPSRTRQSPTSNNHRLQRIGLAGQRRTPTPLMEPVPPFRGIHKLPDSLRESTEILRTFDILRHVRLGTGHCDWQMRNQYNRPEEPITLSTIRAFRIASTCHLLPDSLGFKALHSSKMKSLACLILCYAPLRQSSMPVNPMRPCPAR